MTFIIHGATGAQGAPVATALLQAGHSVTAAVRNPQTYQQGPAVAIDLSNAAALADAYTGVDGVFVHLPLGSPGQQLELARTIIAAVDEARPARVVFSTSGYDLGEGEDSPHGVLMRGLLDTGVSTAIIAPRLYLENLLLPPVIAAAREHGVLPYPIRADYRVSWSSHLDVADVAAQLFDRVDITGTIAVGARPGLLGDDLAAGFAAYLAHPVRFESQTPEAFGDSLIPIFGGDAMTPVIDSYRARSTQQDDVIDASRSAQTLLGRHPRSVEAWLRDTNA
ncbi:hydroxylase [Arthrobacter sp. Leaf234]|uniref:SDR family oxidoreductase n=1 Tax=Arthrobacter sp. Leaf234 TaxID=1736303 RepID=UPI0007009567|nr:NAD(P)H-binding protein [Arthrobacter sp. Leaf234]KQO03270.1 hydroxylase [Arthrobacter sp. Leaf234]